MLHPFKCFDIITIILCVSSIANRVPENLVFKDWPRLPQSRPVLGWLKYARPSKLRKICKTDAYVLIEVFSGHWSQPSWGSR